MKATRTIHLWVEHPLFTEDKKPHCGQRKKNSFFYVRKIIFVRRTNGFSLLTQEGFKWNFTRRHFILFLFFILFFPIGSALHTSCASPRQWPSKFVNNNHRLLQCLGFEWQCTNLRSDELFKWNLRKYSNRKRCCYG